MVPLLMYLLLTLLAVFTSLLGCAHASLNLEVQLVSYKIEGTKLVKGTVELRLCLKPTKDLPNAPPCPFGEFFVLPESLNDGATYYKESKLSSQSFLFTNFWPQGEFRLVIEASASESTFTFRKPFDTVVIPFSKSTPITNTLSQVMLYKGKQQTTSMRVRYRITTDCPTNKYGNHCEVDCNPTDVDDVSGCQSVCNYLGDTICLNRSYYRSHIQEETEARALRSAGNQTQNMNIQLDSVTVVIIVVVSIFGGYALILGALIVIFVSCFVTCTNGKCKLTKKGRIKCPKRVTKGVDRLCSFCHCSSCCNEVCDSDDWMFWIEIVILAIVCFPFALCFLILWAFASGSN